MHCCVIVDAGNVESEGHLGANVFVRCAEEAPRKRHRLALIHHSSQTWPLADTIFVETREKVRELHVAPQITGRAAEGRTRQKQEGELTASHLDDSALVLSSSFELESAFPVIA